MKSTRIHNVRIGGRIADLLVDSVNLSLQSGTASTAWAHKHSYLLNTPLSDLLRHPTGFGQEINEATLDIGHDLVSKFLCSRGKSTIHKKLAENPPKILVDSSDAYSPSFRNGIW